MTHISVYQEHQNIIKQLREAGLNTPKTTAKLNVLGNYLDSLNLSFEATQEEITEVITMELEKMNKTEVKTQPDTVNLDNKKTVFVESLDTISQTPETIETKQDETAPEIETVIPEVVETIRYSLADTLRSKDFNGNILGAKVKIIGNWSTVKNILLDKLVFKVYFNSVHTLTLTCENYSFTRQDKELSSAAEKKMYSNLKTGNEQQDFLFNNLEIICQRAPLIGLFFNLFAKTVDNNDCSQQQPENMIIDINDLFDSCRKIESILKSKNEEYPLHFKFLTRYLRANTDY